MKIFANNNIWKKIVLIFTIVTTLSFVAPKPVAAGIGGDLMEPICDLLVGLGDGIVRVTHNLVIKQNISLIRIDKNEGWIKAVRVIVSIAVGIAIAIAVGAATGGIGMLLTGAETIIAALTVPTVLFSAGAGVYVGAMVYTADAFDNEVNLPLYSVTPEEIFTGDIPLFNVNFFDTNPEESNVYYSNAVSTDQAEALKGLDYVTLVAMENNVATAVKDKPGTEKVDLKLKDYGINGAETIINSSYTCSEVKSPYKYTYYFYQIDKGILKLTERDELEKPKKGNEYYALDIAESKKIEDVIKTNTDSGYIYSFSHQLQEIIATWYYALRMIAIVGMMSVLVYTGIRILIASNSSQKAKYKQLLGDWLVGMILLFSIHYIMNFANLFVDKITDVLKEINPSQHVAVIEDEGDKIYDTLTNEDEVNIEVIEITQEPDSSTTDSTTDSTTNSTKANVVYHFSKDGKNYIEWHTNLMGAVRIKLDEFANGKDDSYIGYTIMYIVLIIYTVIFCFTYIKRVIYMSFLTLIAPLVALTYPIDKANDGNAQGFNYWFKEYIFNLLMQPLHLLLYTILVSAAIELATQNWIYSLVALGFIVSAENIVRQMFNFGKANTPGVFGGAAGAAVAMSGMRWLFGHGPKGGSHGSGSKGGDSSKDADGNLITAGNTHQKNVDDVLKGKGETKDAKDAEDVTSDKNVSQTLDSNMNSENLDPHAQAMEDWVNDQDNLWDGSSVKQKEINDIEPDHIDNSDSPEVDTSNSSKEEKPGLKSAFRNAAGAYKDGIKRRLRNVDPGRTLGRFTMGAAGAATFGMLGVAAGVASGNFGDVAKYGAAGLAGGYKLNRDAFNAASGALHVDGVGSQFERGLYGEKEYKERQAERAQKQKAESEATIRKIQEKLNVSREEAKRKAQEWAPIYMDNEIDNVSDWIKLEKMTKEVDSVTGREYTRDEAIAAYRIYDRYNVANKTGKQKQKEVIEQIMQDYGVSEPEASAGLRMANTFSQLKNG